jgi:hypothetical protein
VCFVSSIVHLASRANGRKQMFSGCDDLMNR